MNPAALDRAVRRGQLIERSAQLRRRLAEDGHALARVCAVADHIGAGARQVRAHPEWVFGGMLAMALLKPRRAWRLGRAAMIGWRAWVSLRRHWPGVLGKART